MDHSQVTDCDTVDKASVTRIIGYARESTREQAENGFNLDEQERKIREYLDVYYDDQDYQFEMLREEGASARSLNRPLMIEIIKAKINLIMNYCLDHYDEYGIERHNWVDVSKERRQWNNGHFFKEDMRDWPEFQEA